MIKAVINHFFVYALLGSIAILGTLPVIAQQPGALDLSFNNSDKGRAHADGTSQVYAVEHQPDGKILIGGNFVYIHGVIKNRIARLLADGSLDTSFNSGTGGGGRVLAIALQPDGKILLGGLNVYNGVLQKGLIRVHPNGTRDTSLVTGTGANDAVYAMALQPDGKILIGGRFTDFNGRSCNRLARLHPIGSLDTLFIAGAGANDTVMAIVLQPDGKILISGSFTQYNGVVCNRLVRLNTDGTVDPSFNVGTGTNSGIKALCLQPDGTIMIGGQFTQCQSVARKCIARLHPNGALDTSFDPGSGYTARSAIVNVISIQPDGKLLVGGDYTMYNGVYRSGLTRLLPNGTLDTTLYSTQTPNWPVYCIKVQPDNKILIGFESDAYNKVARGAFERLYTDGHSDPTINMDTGVYGSVGKIAVQPDGKIIALGRFGRYNGVQRNFIARTYPDGSLDRSFDTGISFPGQGSGAYVGSANYCSTIEVLPSGKILLLSLGMTSFNGTPSRGLVQLLPNGQLDTSFSAAAADSTITGFARQPDGKIIIMGYFRSYAGAGRNYIARLHPSGALDAGFDPGTGFDNISIFPPAMKIQPDGKILIGSFFSNYNGTGVQNLVRLHPDGSLDATFQVSSGPNGFVKVIELQADGKILISGDFTDVNGTLRNKIARLLPDGTLDMSFNVSAQPNYFRIHDIKALPGNKILIAGNFSAIGNTSRSCIARLHPDGTLDTSFDTGTGAGTVVYGTLSGSDQGIAMLALQQDGKVLIGGSFDIYNGTGRNRLARVYGDYIAPTLAANPLSAAVFCPGEALQVPYTVQGTYEFGNVFTAQLSNASGSFANPVNIGTLAQTTSGSISATIPFGTMPGSGYRIRVISSNPALISNDTGFDLTIHSVPVLTLQAQPAAICLGASAVLSATGGQSYSWSGGNGLAAQTGNSVSTTPIATGIFFYKVTGTGANGCTTSDSAALQVKPLPVATATASPALVCMGSEAVLSASGGDSYSWSGPGNYQSAEHNPVLIPTATGAYTVTVSSTATGCSNTASTVVQVLPLPLSYAGPDREVCPGVPTRFSATAVPGMQYLWSPATGLSSATLPDPLATLLQPQQYSLTVTDTATGCSSIDIIQIALTQVTPLLASPGRAQGIAPFSVQFLNQTQGTATFTWSFGDGSSNGANSPNYTYTMPGTFYVTLSAVFGADCIVSDTVSVIEVQPGTVPNVITPNGDGKNDVFELQLSSQPVQLTVYNRWGRQVYESKAYQQDWKAENLSEGLYFYHAVTSGGKAVQGWVEVIR